MSSRPPLIVHTESSRVWGGQEIRTLTELRQMQKCGFRVALIAQTDSELARRATAEGLPVHTLASFRKLSPRSWCELFRLFRALKPAVVNTHSSDDSWMAGPLARLCRVPLVIRTRHVLVPVSSTLSYGFAHLIFTCSGAIAEQLTACGIPPAKMVVLPTGNDERRFQFSPSHRHEVRQRYHISDQEILVGNVGCLRSYKGHRFILKTAASMPEHYRFMIVGDGEGLRALRTMAHDLGVEERVIFAGHQEAPEHFFSAFDLCFFSSFEAEGVSQSLIQSLLNGLPVLACRIASSVEPLAVVEDCRLVDYGDVQAACQGLAELALLPRRDPERMARQHQRIADCYGLENMVRILLATYGRHSIHPRPQE
ncbi:MAG: glycosyltransferase [Proteobacteria bacterium]|nr:glycosyltransferase [Pseudomonadota bacterium]